MEATLNLADQSGVAEARRVALKVAHAIGISERTQADVALVATEAATNIIKYAGHGEITLRRYTDGDVQGLEVLAVDRGPGIPNLEAARRDGYSTGNSLGAGLGTIERHSSLFDIYSLEGAGTALMARIAGEKSSDRHSVSRSSRFVHGARSTPKLGQEICGDAWSVDEANGNLRVVLLDGLGHGPLASDASLRAVGVFLQSNPADTPADILRTAHEALKSTRGAVMSVARIEPDKNSISFAGVGNIVGLVVSGESTQHLLSTDGTVGYNMRLVRESTLDWTARSMLILTTDGLSTRWNLNRHPGLAQHHPSLIASVLHRDFARDSDDATVVVVKAS